MYRPAGEDNDYAYIEYPLKAAATGVDIFPDTAIKALIREPTTGLTVGGLTNDTFQSGDLFRIQRQAKWDKIVQVFPSESVTLESSTANLDRMIARTEGPGDSGTYYFIDFPTKKIEAIGWDYPTILQGDVAPVKAFWNTRPPMGSRSRAF